MSILKLQGCSLKLQVEAPRKLANLPEGLPDFVYDASLDAKTRARLIENEMNEQAKIVQDLKQLGNIFRRISLRF